MKNQLMTSVQYLPPLILLFLIFSANVKAQTGQEKQIIYKSWISLTYKDSVDAKGFILAAEDSSIVIADGLIKDVGVYYFLPERRFNYREIDMIKIRRKGQGGTYTVIGTLTGLAVGIVIGLAEGDDPPCPATGNWLFPCTQTTAGDKALAYGFTGALLGGIAGAVIGSIKIKIPVNGDLNLYRANKPRLKKYVLQQ